MSFFFPIKRNDPVSYERDHTYLEEYLNSAVPRGRIGHVGGTAPTTGYTTEADVSSMTVTIEADVDRYYSVTWIARIQQQTSAGIVTARITDGAGTSAMAWVETLTAGGAATINLFFIVQPAAGPLTYKARIGTSAGTVDVVASVTAPQFLVVADIGGVA